MDDFLREKVNEVKSKCNMRDLETAQMKFYAASIQIHDFRFKLQLYLLKSRKRTAKYLRNQFIEPEHIAWLELYLNREYGNEIAIDDAEVIETVEDEDEGDEGDDDDGGSSGGEAAVAVAAATPWAMLRHEVTPLLLSLPSPITIFFSSFLLFFSHLFSSLHSCAALPQLCVDHMCRSRLRRRNSRTRARF